jgi:sRNA-binding protein
MLYRPNREESEAVIAALAESYPRCFFTNPQQRRPLKKNIVADLQKDGFGAASELLTAAISWYESHFSYQHNLQAGTKRVDLRGREVGTVTREEQLAAQKKVQGDRRRKEAETSATRYAASCEELKTSRHNAAEQLFRKADTVGTKKTPQPAAPAAPIAPAVLVAQEPMALAAPDKVTVPEKPASLPAIAPELAKLHDVFLAANEALAGSHPALRKVMASAALKVVATEAKAAVKALRDQE